MKIRRGLYTIWAGAILSACSPSKPVSAPPEQPANTISELKFLSEYVVPHNRSFKGTTIGGLSGIDYDAAKKVYYMVCDDRSEINPARFYTAAIYLDGDKIDSVQFTEVTTFLRANGTAYPNTKQDPLHTPDPEALRYNPKTDQLIWASEGERIISGQRTILEDPAITAIRPDGTYIDTFELPALLHMQAAQQGPRQNGVLEGLAFADDFRSLYASVEEPLYEDGPVAGTGDSTAWTRLIRYDVASRKPVAQYAYQIEPVAYAAQPAGAFKINGISDILAVGTHQLLVVERSFSTGRIDCVVKVFLADLSGATDISHMASLQGAAAFVPASKKLLLNMNTLGRFIDNVEGVTFGPTLKNGHLTLLFVADNNFNAFEKNQFLLFEVMP